MRNLGHHGTHIHTFWHDYVKLMSLPFFICSKRVDGKFLGPGGTFPASQAICSSLLEECFEIAQEIRAQEESKHVASSLKPIYDRLKDIRAELEGLALTHRWSLRETDLWNYSLSLQEVDKMRIEGKFVDSEGDQPSGQYVRFLKSSLTLVHYIASFTE
jgi:NTP pyrophosphatase (non-canonical NTP hydrolase)